MEEKSKKEKIKQSILNYLREGMFKKDSAAMSGIDESTLYRWIEKDASFASQVEASILKYKHSLIQILNTQAEKNGMLALQILKTRWYREWGVAQSTEQSEEDARSLKRIADSLDASFAREHEEEGYQNNSAKNPNL